MTITGIRPRASPGIGPDCLKVSSTVNWHLSEPIAAFIRSPTTWRQPHRPAHQCSRIGGEKGYPSPQADAACSAILNERYGTVPIACPAMRQFCQMSRSEACPKVNARCQRPCTRLTGTTAVPLWLPASSRSSLSSSVSLSSSRRAARSRTSRRSRSRVTVLPNALSTIF